MDAILKEVFTYFHSTDDDLNDDTKLFVNIKLSDGTIVATNGPEGTKFPDGIPDHTTKSIELFLMQFNVTKADLQGGTTEVIIDPNGDDEWKFNYTLTLRFSDNSLLPYEWHGNELEENKTSITFRLS